MLVEECVCADCGNKFYGDPRGPLTCGDCKRMQEFHALDQHLQELDKPSLELRLRRIEIQLYHMSNSAWMETPDG